MTQLSIGRVWQESAAFVRAEHRLLVPLALAGLALPATLLAMIVPPDAAGDAMSAAEKTQAGPWIFAALAALSVMLVAQLAISRLTLGWDRSLGQAIRHGARRFLPLFLANLLLALAIMFPLLLTVGLIGTAAPAAGKLITVLLVIPIILLFLRASLSLPVAAAEGIGPVGILRRSFSISRGQTVRLVGFALLFVIAALVVATAVSVVSGAIIVTLLGKPEPWTVSAALLALVSGLVQAAIIVLWTVMLSRIYVQLAVEQPAA